MNIQQQAKAIRKAAIGAVIIQYSALEIIDDTKQELKQRLRRLLKAGQDVENWFLLHPLAKNDTRKTFRREFLSGEVYLLSEILELLWGVPENDLEDLLNQLKQNISDEKEKTQTQAAETNP